MEGVLLLLLRQACGGGPPNRQIDTALKPKLKKFTTAGNQRVVIHFGRSMEVSAVESNMGASRPDDVCPT